VNNKGIIHLISLFLILLVMGIGAWWLLENANPNLIFVSTTSTPYPTPTTSKAVTPIDWKKYIDNDYYFSFEYPDTWSIFGANNDYEPPSDTYYLTISTEGSAYNSSNQLDLPVLHGATLSISIPATTTLSLSEWFEKEIRPSLETLKQQQGNDFDIVYDFELGQKTAIKVNTFFLIPQHSFYVKHKNYVYGVHYNIGPTDEDDLKPIIDHILSTFEFVDM